MTRPPYLLWRRIHMAASGALSLIAIVHCALTWRIFAAWTPDAVWFLGTGLGLLLLGAINLSHIGVEPCQQPTSRVVRVANWAFVAFGLAAFWAVPEPQAFAIVACLLIQALASHATLPGPV